MTETYWKELSGGSEEEGPPGDAQSIADMAKDADERLFRAITTDPSMGDWAETWRRVWEDGKKLSRTK